MPLTNHMRRLTLGSFVAALTSVSAQAAPPLPVFSVHPDPTNRYLVDSNNVPFLMVGDAPQALIGNLSEAQANFFMKDRQKYGINALWINLLCASYTALQFRRDDL